MEVPALLEDLSVSPKFLEKCESINLAQPKILHTPLDGFNINSGGHDGGGDAHGSALTPEFCNFHICATFSQVRASVTSVTISHGCAHARKSSTNRRNSLLFDRFHCVSLFLSVLNLRKPTQARRTVLK